MGLYILYRIGYFLAMNLPMKVSYAIACAIADIWYCISSADRKAVIANLNTITDHNADAKKIRRMAKDVFSFSVSIATFLSAS